MTKIGDLIKEADWKTEKHVPVIECQDAVKADERIEVRVGIGKEIAHPNTTEHHIMWISLFFYPEGEKFPIHIGRCEFYAHGASVLGPNTSSIYTLHEVATWFKTGKPGTIVALSLCNIHGLWQSSKDVKLK
ncbi:class II SORL domain-containing protein [Candidatus Bathyarchaeota archaeon]|nr:class II SORL domain-containing protein [Candidatus Bathyarchaeota archaeon]